MATAYGYTAKNVSPCDRRVPRVNWDSSLRNVSMVAVGAVIGRPRSRYVPLRIGWR